MVLNGNEWKFSAFDGGIGNLRAWLRTAGARASIHNLNAAAGKAPARYAVNASCAEFANDLAKSRHPFWSADRRSGARHAVRQSRRQVSQRRPHARPAALGVAAMDLLCTRL